MAFDLAHNFGHPMRDTILFGCCGHESKLLQAGGADDALGGELREEEIVWGEGGMHHQYKDLISGAERSKGKAISHAGDRPIRHRSILSRQMQEMKANTWSAGNSTMSTVRSTKGSTAAAMDHNNQEVEAGGEEEEGGMQRRKMDDQLVPPHELLARQYAATASYSFSVLQGAGRTLKGRDLRRLRNEVWRQTGFAD